MDVKYALYIILVILFSLLTFCLGYKRVGPRLKGRLGRILGIAVMIITFFLKNTMLRGSIAYICCSSIGWGITLGFVLCDKDGIERIRKAFRS